MIYKMLPFAILLVIAGFFIGMANGDTVWGYIGMGLIIAPAALTLGVVLILTLIYWRRNKATTDKRFSEVSVILIFNAVVALSLLGYLTWKNITILDNNMFLIICMAINIGALRIIWIPKEDDTSGQASIINNNNEEEKEEAI